MLCRARSARRRSGAYGTRAASCTTFHPTPRCGHHPYPEEPFSLLDTEYEANEEARVNRAFRHPGEDPADMELFDAYTRGGVEVLHEKLIEGVSDPSEYISRLYEFVEEFDERFNDGITSDVLLSLCAGK